jgi:hypothetical protein
MLICNKAVKVLQDRLELRYKDWKKSKILKKSLNLELSHVFEGCIKTEP